MLVDMQADQSLFKQVQQRESAFGPFEQDQQIDDLDDIPGVIGHREEQRCANDHVADRPVQDEIRSFFRQEPCVEQIDVLVKKNIDHEQQYEVVGRQACEMILEKIDPDDADHAEG